MARWKLKDGHYINVAGTEWEYKETDRNTGRQARKVYEVPLYLNPKFREDHNYPEEEAIIVANKFNPAFPRDIIFQGPPTPDMDPLDDEAQAISDAESHKWVHPIEALNMTYSESRLSEFEREIAMLMAKQANESVPVKTPSRTLGGVSPADFERLQQQIAELAERNAKLEAALHPQIKRRA